MFHMTGLPLSCDCTSLRTVAKWAGSAPRMLATRSLLIISGSMVPKVGSNGEREPGIKQVMQSQVNSEAGEVGVVVCEGAAAV